jgi:predicted TIM-barrel fold metal-dependent hydrolase
MVEAIKQGPEHLSGFAALQMAYPDEAVKELERAVTELGLLRALVDNHLEYMMHYSNEKFWPIFTVAEKMDIPIYLHPSLPSPE